MAMADDHHGFIHQRQLTRWAAARDAMLAPGALRERDAVWWRQSLIPLCAGQCGRPVGSLRADRSLSKCVGGE